MEYEQMRDLSKQLDGVYREMDNLRISLSGTAQGLVDAANSGVSHDIIIDYLKKKVGEHQEEMARLQKRRDEIWAILYPNTPLQGETACAQVAQETMKTLDSPIQS